MSKNTSPIDADFANIFFKPIAHYLSNPETAEVMVNAHDDIWVEDDKGLWKAPETFTQDALVSAVNSLAQYVGRPLMENVFSVDARMPDGSRVCIVLPPVSGKDPIFAIRKFKEIVSDLDFLVKKNSLTAEMVELIDSCVKIKKNIMVAGGTSSGKTTLLNLIAAKIPDNDRIVTIEDSRELQLKQDHVLSLEARPADKHGKGEFTIRQCLKSTLRLRPDRIIVGEIRGGEAFDLIQAMNTGHGGCMGTVHANTPTDTLRRIESLALTTDVDMPLVALRSMIASALDLVISPARLSDGTRRIIQIAEIGPLTDKGDYITFDIVRFVSTHRDKNTGKIKGYFEFTGHVPSFFEMFEAEGVDVPLEFFRRRVMGEVPPEDVPKLLAKGFEVPGHAKPEPRYLNLPFEGSQDPQEVFSTAVPAAQAVAAASLHTEAKPEPAEIAQAQTQAPLQTHFEPETPVQPQVNLETATPIEYTAEPSRPIEMAPEPTEVFPVQAANFQDESFGQPEEAIELTDAKPEYAIETVQEPIFEPESFEETNAKPEPVFDNEITEAINETPAQAVTAEDHSFDEYFAQPIPVTAEEETLLPKEPETAPEEPLHFKITKNTEPEPAQPQTPPARPSLLERLSRISGTQPNSQPSETIAPESYIQPEAYPASEPVEDQYTYEPSQTSPITEAAFQEEEPAPLSQNNDDYVSPQVSQESLQDDYQSPAAFSFEEEVTAPAEPQEEAPSPRNFDFHYSNEGPQQAANFPEEIPQAQPQTEEEKPPESKQHVVIAEILKRMRESRSNQG